MVVVKETDTGGIPAPAVTICARNEGDKQQVSESCNGAANVFSCMESESWARMKDVILDAEQGESPTNKDLKEAMFWDWQIRSLFECFTFSMNDRISPLYQRDMLHFFINNTTMIYEFLIHDLDYFIPNWNRLVLPINRFKVFPKTECTGFVSISLTEKHELSTAHDPCDERKNYNFRQCIKESIASHVGCEGKESCVTGEQYR